MILNRHSAFPTKVADECVILGHSEAVVAIVNVEYIDAKALSTVINTHDELVEALRTASYEVGAKTLAEIQDLLSKLEQDD